MGSSGEPNTKAIDPSVGGLVWVRRRNGSWWPGRIMGLDELSESCLVSPRSGTPVKLLGREDASVDWYNLEKSKRVKAFRCGEYDECIEKAKASAANSNKKAVKYARREDAILHALEIENARESKDRLDVCSDNSGAEEHGSWARESPAMFDPDKENDDMADEGRRRRTPNDSEDDGTEGAKRMKGLEDLGLGVVSTRKVQAGGVLELVQQDSVALCDNGNCTPGGSPVNGSKGYFTSLKRKRTQVANVQEFLKRKNRRRPLTKVLESTAMVSVPVMCDQLASSSGSPLRGVSDGKVSGLESNESKRSFSMVINNNSDSTGVSYENGASLNASEHASDVSHIPYKLKENEISSMSGLHENDSSDRLFDVPFVGEEKHSAGFSPIFVSCSSGKPQVGGLGRQSSQSSQAETVSLRNEGLNESGSTSSEAVHTSNCNQRIEKGTSKWQLKGKRNSRHINKNRKQNLRKSVDMDDESDAYLAGIEHQDGFSLGSDQKVDCNPVGGSVISDSCTLQGKSKPVIDDQESGHRNWSRHISHREPHLRGPTSEVKRLPDCSLTPQRSLPYRHSRFTVNPRYQMPDLPFRNFYSNSCLYDVNLEVKANYRPQHVPLVSLMSKLNGKAIVGHPLTVEVLDDLSDLLLSDSEYDPTTMSVSEGDEMGYAVKRNSETRRLPTKHSTLQLRVSPSKSPKMKKGGLLSKKIRKLSSLTGSHKKRDEERKPVVDKLKGPAIACIPLKLVFSRLNEAVNSSARPAHHALTPSDP
uniref:PWWP domain-containing protein n=1 Tax=Vitis vinifera TaxID=29760 RepID=F6HY39_VITVI